MKGLSTSMGTQMKELRPDGYWYKYDTYGYESIAECLASELEACIQDFEYIEYWMYQEPEACGGRYGCRSLNFLDSGEMCMSVHRLLQRDLDVYILYEEYDGEYLRDIVEGSIRLTTGINPHEYFGKLLKFDALILNNDRHFNNICFKKCTTGEFMAMPNFDNGAGFLSNLKKYPLEENLGSIMSKVFSKPFLNDFEKQCELFSDTPMLRIDIQKFYSRINEIGENVLFKSTEYKRALSVLEIQLKKFEGKIWKPL